MVFLPFWSPPKRRWTLRGGAGKDGFARHGPHHGPLLVHQGPRAGGVTVGPVKSDEKKKGWLMPQDDPGFQVVNLFLFFGGFSGFEAFALKTCQPS